MPGIRIVGLSSDGGVKSGPCSYFFLGQPLAIEGGWEMAASETNVLPGPSTAGPVSPGSATRASGDAVEHVDEALLAHLGDGLDGRPVDDHVDEVRCRRRVVVPEPVMNTPTSRSL